MAKRLQMARKATKKSKAPAPRRSKRAAKASTGQENARLKRELSEALERQKATGEILAAINSSTSELQPILDMIARTASRLCEAEYALIYKLQGGKYHVAASNNTAADFIKYAVSHPVMPGRGSLVGRTVIERKTVHLPDCLADPEYEVRDYQQAGRYRTSLGVPLQQGGDTPLGVIVLMRARVKPFTERQIDLVTTFANQAMIAIENARLFDEVTARTEDLRQSLEYQTATSEVLGIISRSPTDVQPVFEAIAASALRLCGAKWSVVTRFDGAQLHLAALHNLSDPEGVDAIRKIFPRPLSRGGPTDRAILTGTVINLPDVLKDPEYIYQSISKAARYRSHLAVPTIRDGNAVGAITVAGEHTAAFTERHVNLLKAFADQAVIAIDNVRLFDEVNARTDDLRESLQQQTATADVLKVISRSTFDLQTVLDTLTESAARLCGADMGAIARQGADGYYHSTNYNFPIDWVKVADPPHSAGAREPSWTGAAGSKGSADCRRSL
jgi:GAF domain-containing protein